MKQLFLSSVTKANCDSFTDERIFCLGLTKSQSLYYDFYLD